MRFPRITTRRWMIVVALIGLVSGSAIALKRRSETFWDCAQFHAAEIYGIEEEIDPSIDWQTFWYLDQPERQPKNQEPKKFQPPGVYPPSETDSPETKVWRLSQQGRVAYHEAAMAKYLRASHYPWLPVAPDPPKPK